MEETNDKEATLLARWISGDITEEEAMRLKSDPDAAIYKKIITASENLYLEKPDMDEQYRALLNKRDSTISLTKKTTTRTWVFAIAAVLLVIFGINYVFISQNQQGISTAIAQTKKITLPDNSVITLNALSSVSYNENEFLTNRILTLNGEAYFEVEKGSSFTVQTANGNVTVLGTAFNVYTRDEDITVYCDEGRVEVQRDDKTIVLEANEGAFAKAEIPLSSTPPAIKSPQWRSGRTFFQKEPLREVYRSLERQFPVTIQMENIDANRPYSGYFDHSNLEDALNEISKPMHITYEIKGSEVILSPAQ